MIKKKIILFLIISFCATVKAQDLQKLATNYDYIQLSHLDMENWEIDDYSIPLLKAYTYTAVANYKESGKEIELVLGIDSVSKNPRVMIQVLGLQASNYSKTYQYKQAAECYKKILYMYSSVLGKANAKFQNKYKLFNALSEVGPLQVSIPHNTKITTRPDKKGLPLVQVGTPKDTISLIFDTGAGFSSVTKSTAKKLGIKILTDSLMAGGSAGNVEYMSIGIADTLYFGDIRYENVIFLVFEDEKMTFPEHGYAANGTLGFPEIQILPAIKIYKNGALEITKNSDKNKRNMMFTNSNQIIVQANDTLLLFLDTGSASGSNLSVNYYKKNKSQISKVRELTTKVVNGMGGSNEFPVYILNDFPLKIDTTTTTLPRISIFTERKTKWTYEYDGSLGQDVIVQYDYILLDFKNMYFSLKNE